MKHDKDYRMTQLEKPSKFESITGNLFTEVGMTALAAYFATPLSALLPVLSHSLASGRHKTRVEKALNEINQKLLEHHKQIENLSDAQYKIINEVVLTILQTTEDEKIKYLKLAVENNLREEIVPLSYASHVSRVLRDISADELTFLINNSRYSTIIFGGKPMKDDELLVNPNGDEGIIVSGLIAMGLMTPGASTFDVIGRYSFSPVVNKLLEVIST